MKHEMVKVDDNFSIYLRLIPSIRSSNKAAILLNSRSLCVESSMGIPMGGLSFGDYLSQQGINAVLVDLRGYGLSTPVQEQFADKKDQIEHPLTFDDYHQDLKAVIDWIKHRLGSETEISIIGFSFLGPMIVAFSHLYPDLVQKLICLNPYWSREKGDPVSGFNFLTKVADDCPYQEVSMEKIDQRLRSSQPQNKDFIEALWYNEAKSALAEFHRTYDPIKKVWRVVSLSSETVNNYIKKFKGMPNSQAEILIISAQYDTENPRWLIFRMFEELAVTKKYLKILPNATHLCIWENARTTLYKWTTEFIL